MYFANTLTSSRVEFSEKEMQILGNPPAIRFTCLPDKPQTWLVIRPYHEEIGEHVDPDILNVLRYNEERSHRADYPYYCQFRAILKQTLERNGLIRFGNTRVVTKVSKDPLCLVGEKPKEFVPVSVRTIKKGYTKIQRKKPSTKSLPIPTTTENLGLAQPEVKTPPVAPTIIPAGNAELHHFHDVLSAVRFLNQRKGELGDMMVMEVTKEGKLKIILEYS